MNADPLALLIEQTDYLHPPLPTDPLSSRYKEWYHLCVLAPGADVVLNLNLGADTRPAVRAGALAAHMVLLVRERAWEGDVDMFPERDVRIEPGRLGLSLGHNSIRFRHGSFECSVALRERPVTLTLTLQPVTAPLFLRNDMPLGEVMLNWLVVPRLVAQGTLVVGERVYALENAPAYHDHNWGRWAWGSDFCWVWGFSLADQDGVRWSVMFNHTTNRVRSRSLEITLALWKNDSMYRVFSQHEIAVRPAKHIRPIKPAKFPRVMALIAPEYTTDVPQRLEILASAGGDFLSLQFEASDVGQILVPNETDLGVTIINEATGRLSAEGRVRGEQIAFQERGIFEFTLS